MIEIITEPIECGFTHLRGTPVFVMAGENTTAFKRIFGATFVKSHFIWMFPAFYPFVEDVLHDLKIVAPNTKFTKGARAHIETTQTGASLHPDFEYVTTPYTHQEDGLLFLLGNLRGGLFFDCGLGKTKVVVDLVRHEKEKTLVLVPVVGIEMWVREVDLHSGGALRVATLTGRSKAGKRAAKKAKDEKTSPARMAKCTEITEAAEADILVVGYETAKRYQGEIFDGFDYKMIVADESHNLRDSHSVRTRAVLALASKAKRRILLSGTPALGNPLHLYGQLSFLGTYVPAIDWWIFRKRYVTTAKSSPRIVTGYRNLELLNKKVQRIGIRRLKDECLDLPSRTITDIYYDLDPAQRKMYNDLVESMFIELASGELYEPDHAAVALTKLLQILGGFFIQPSPSPPVCDSCVQVARCVQERIRPFTRRCSEYPTPLAQKYELVGKTNPRLEALAHLLDSILQAPKNKAIIWAYFRAELDIVEKHLLDMDIGFVRVDGSNSQHAPELAEEFNGNPRVRIYLAQISTGTTLTLNAGAYMIYFGLTFRLDDYLQSMDRNHRIGQSAPTFVYRLLVRNSALEFVARALSRKEDIAATITGKIDCVLCAQMGECAGSGVKPFTDGCIYKDKVSRVICRPGKL